FAVSLGLAARLRRQAGVHVLDEGPMKRAATLALGSRAPQRLLRSIPRPDLAVLVTCDVEVRLDRLRATGRVHAWELTDDELRRRDERRAVGDRWVAEQGGVDVLVVDTSAGEDLSGQVAEA